MLGMFMNPYDPPQTDFGPSDVLPSDLAKGVPSDDTVATIIPYKNAAALIAYYLGLFSCFPVLGFFMAVASLVLGVMGLKAVRRNPKAHGTVHAWVGLICGTIGLLINSLIIFGIVMAIVTRGAQR